MAELASGDAPGMAGLPLAVGGATLAALPEAAMAEILPFRDGAAAVAAALGAALPAPGRATALGDGSTLAWLGLDRWLLRGPAAAGLAGRLGGAAAVIDQSDGWIALSLAGPAAAGVLARLLPLDLAPEAFPPDAACRSALRHVPCLVLGAAAGFGILAPRSYGASVISELAEAMRSVAARAAIGG
ncbi:sarcosine oxidase subunit gamma family protein [Amaricoccus sp.]|uniref:sarcosine oxidase subunit gamma family protein n=1 Tax=Amaricoccus sp. TaxID=1872485 RepID=UPI001B6042C5|nr:sarcosine oxidase subunit gamma family protein [Amaricoccus sp.]MBP7003200.1 sarcosine oxidase subunit gamma [Amaricoccus sp.]